MTDEERQKRDGEVLVMRTNGDKRDPVPLASFNGIPRTRAHKVYTTISAMLDEGHEDGEVEVGGAKYRFGVQHKE